MKDDIKKTFSKTHVRTPFVLAGDLTCILLSFFITFYIYKLRVDLSYKEIIKSHAPYFIFLYLIWMMTFFIDGFYKTITLSKTKLFSKIFKLSSICVVISFIYFYFLSLEKITPKTNIFINVTIFAVLLFSWRSITNLFFSQSFLVHKILILGNAKIIKEIQDFLEKNKTSGYKVEKILGLEEAKSSNFEEIVDNRNIDLVAIDRNFFQERDLLSKVLKLLSKNIPIYDLSQMSEMLLGEIPLESIEDTWLLTHLGGQKSQRYLIAKRMMDIVISLIILCFIIPIYIPVILFLLIKEGRPIFFTQKRTGIYGENFTLVKLRTMTVEAEKDGAKWATPNDSRITKVGKFLRKTRLDEFPQLLNILSGEMSLVGPRPERPEFVSKLKEDIPFYDQRHLVKPGLTGWAQINYGYGYSVDDAIKKLRYDLYYVKNKSIWFDMAIILKTIKTVITGAGH